MLVGLSCLLQLLDLLYFLHGFIRRKKGDAKEIKEMETKLRKNLAQLRMARYTLIGMGVFTVAMFFVPIDRVTALSDISNLFYISGAGIVGTYMGTSAYMQKNGVK